MNKTTCAAVRRERSMDMRYTSTRDTAVDMSAAEAVKMGLSRDGGLLTPVEIPQIGRAFLEGLLPMRYQERAAAVMGLYLTDYTAEELTGLLACYAGLLDRPEKVTAGALVHEFSWAKVPKNDVVVCLS